MKPKSYYFIFTLGILVNIHQLLFGYSYLPNIESFDKQDYSAGRQNWCIDIDDNGVVYFGNSDGLLYNIYGEWGFTSMTHRGVIRAIKTDNDTIWSGGAEFGYFIKKEGGYAFTNLGNLNGRQVWNIVLDGKNVVFQGEDRLIFYNKRTDSICSTNYENGIWAITDWNNKVWVMLRNGQLGYLENQKFIAVTKLKELGLSEVRKLMVHNNQLYIILFEGGIYKYDGSTITKFDLPVELKGKALFTGLSYNDNSFCLGSVNDGFLQLSNQNKIENAIDVQKGLLDNTVLAMKKDDLGNIWLGLDYGIAKIELQSAINKVFDGAATYALMDLNEKTYIATNKGLFVSGKNSAVEFVKNSGGQVWNLKQIDNQVYVCHNKGLFRLKNQQLELVENFAGFLDISHFKGTEFYLLSTYHGLLLAKKVGDRFASVNNLNIWGQPKLFYDLKNNCIWASITGKHVIQIFLSENNTVDIKEFPTVIQVFNTDLGIFFCDNTSLLEYKEGQFIVPDNKLLNAVLGEKIKAVDIDVDGKMVAYIQGTEVKLKELLPDGNIHSYNSMLNSLGKNVNPNYEYIDLDNDYMRLATDRGVVVFDVGFHTEFKKSSHPVITSVSVLNEENKSYLYPYPETGLNFQEGNKDLQINFSINKSKYDVVEYRYMLSPLEDQWSEWSTDKNCVMYPQLKGGDYVFNLQSRINEGAPDETILPINIDKLWYHTYLIYIPIILIALVLIFSVILIMNYTNKRKFNNQKKHYNKMHAQKTLTLKQEQLLQYAEIISHKNEFLNKVKTGLENMRNAEAQHWAKMITDEVNHEKKEFIFHKVFSEVHQDFISRLGEMFPELTANDIRILTFIRINLGSNEISNLMNITPRSLDTNRYRLRKKLGLDQGTDLNQFIRDF